MHIPDGFVDAPTALVTAAASLGTLAIAVRRTGREMGERTVPLLGVTAAFIFAAQMLNFPVAAGTSGHFLGAAFAAIVMGPWAAVVVMTVVVAVQAVGMADGGITALGANVLNMGVVAVLVGYLAHRALRAVLPATATWYLAGVAVAAWLSTTAAAVATALELGASGTVPLRLVVPAMTSVHMVIGIGEALITTTVLGTILASRPDLVRNGPRPGSRAGRDSAAVGTEGLGRPVSRPRAGRTWGFLAAALVVAAALAVFVSPFASTAPDGLERVAADQGFDGAGGQAVWNLSPIPDYSLPGFADARLGTAVAGLLGTLIMFALVLGLGRTLGARRPASRPGDPHAGTIHPLGGHEHSDHRHAGHSHRGHEHSARVPEDTDPDHSHTHPKHEEDGR
ncbi:MAG: energy-coupling factor ABC transporter permease [Thermoleophilia bacterium]